MAFQLANNCQETTVTAGTGTITLDGAVTGKKSFASQIANGDTTFYTIQDGTDLEAGIGTLTIAGSDTISRDTVLYSTNGGAKVVWPASGVRNVYCGLPAEVIEGVVSPNHAQGLLMKIGAQKWAVRTIRGGKGIDFTGATNTSTGIQTISGAIKISTGNSGLEFDSASTGAGLRIDVGPGNKLTGAGIELDISGLATVTPALVDLFPFYDVGSSAQRKTTLNVVLDSIDLLTESTGPDPSVDFVHLFEVGSSGARKVKPDNLGNSGLVLLATASASGSSSIDFDGDLVTAYDNYLLTFNNVIPVSDSAFWLRFGQSGAFRSGASDYSWAVTGTMTDAAGVIHLSDDIDSEIQVSARPIDAAKAFSGRIHIYSPGTAGNFKYASWEMVNEDSDSPSQTVTQSGGGEYKRDTSAVDGVRLLMSTGNITSGEFALYGYRKT